MIESFANEKLIRRIIWVSLLIAVFTCVIAFLLGKSWAFLLAVSIAAGISIGLFFAFATLARRSFQRVKNSDDTSGVTSVMLLSGAKILLLAFSLVVLVYYFSLDPLGLIFGVSSIYISLAFVPIFSKQAELDEGGGRGEE